MGRIAPEKSITVIIDALKKVVAINDNIRFLIVGGGPQLEELKEYVNDWKIKVVDVKEIDTSKIKDEQTRYFIETIQEMYK